MEIRGKEKHCKVERSGGVGFENNKPKRGIQVIRKANEISESDQQGTLNGYVNVVSTPKNSDKGGECFGKVGFENNKPTCDKGQQKSEWNKEKLSSSSYIQCICQTYYII